MPKTRTPLAALLTVVVLALPGPARADSARDARAKRDATRAKRAQLAARINALKATDDQLEAAVRTLDESVGAQSSAAQSAQQAAQAASAVLARAEARLAETERQVAMLRSRAAAAAVRAYVHPSGDTLLQLVRSKDLSEASRRQALLTQAVSSDAEVLDALRAARQDQAADRQALARARDLTQDRQRAATSRLRALEAARNEQRRVRSALDARIAEFQNEVDALAKEEAALSALIRAREVPQVPEAAKGAAGRVVGKVSNLGLMWPLSGPVTSGFGMRWGRMHNGIDISAPTGTPIRAAKAGTVIFAGSQGGYGNAVIVSHGGGISTLYAHLSRIGASTGQSVSQGEAVGNVGCTGSCTGPHLHFEVRVGGGAVNPRGYLP